MKKIKLTVVFVMLLQLTFAGGLLTNYNQSAQYVRMLSRNASLDIDAVFYNPAGLTNLQDGWHFAFYSQTIFQKREINSEFPYLNNPYYEGETTIPIFPDLYGVYKKDKWAFSFGVGPAAGGGTANFDNGLPSFEIPFVRLGTGLKQLTPLLSAYDIPATVDNGYDLNMAFEASSIFWGIQLGASYEISDFISVYGGFRIMPSTNSYDGSIYDIMIPTASGDLSAPEYLSSIRPVLEGTINSIDQAWSGLQTAIDMGLVEGNASVSDPSLLQLLGAFGIENVTNEAAVSSLQSTQNKLETIRDANTEDKYVDVKQKGVGFTPIIAVNINPNEDWNIGLKYEHKTNLTLENETTVDNLGLFPDGAEAEYDIPAIFTAGVGFRGLEWLEAQLSYNLYFDKKVNYGYNVRYQTTGQQVARDIAKNYYELALGLQFNITDKFAFSVGGLRSDMGVDDLYQSDFSFSNSSYTLAGGISWKLTDRLTVDAGLLNTFYTEETVTFVDPDFGNYDESYKKTTLSLSAGISYSIF